LSTQEAQLEEHARAVVDLDSARQTLSRENEELKQKLQLLLDRIYGRRSERVVDARQLLLDFGGDTQALHDALAETAAEAEATLDELQTKRKAKRKPRPVGSNQKFPEHLPRYEKIIDLPDEEKSGKTFIGYDEVEQLELQPGSLRVRVFKYAKYSDNKQKVVSPEREVGLVAGNRFDISVAVEVIVARYFYHLPYYRQQDVFTRYGWTPSRSTLLNLVTAVEFIIQPLVNHYRSLLPQVQVAGCDDTPVTLIVPPVMPKLDPRHPRTARIQEVLSAAIAKNRPSVKGRMWAYRPVDLPFNLFDFTVSRHRDGPDEILQNYRGTLLGDCWSGFQKIELRSDERITLAACWAHARRKFYECRLSHPRQVPVVLGLLRELFDVEARAADCTPEERVAIRQRESTPVLDALHEYLTGPEMNQVLPKSNLAAATNYVLNHWDALRVFLTNGLVPLDNNLTEQLMKQVATGRKNWLHIGSISAGMCSANIMTLVSTAARNDLDVWAYLHDVLKQILAGCTDWESLRADRWKESHPEAIRTYRADERRDAADRKQRQRTLRLTRSTAGE
jgi:transposase